MIVPKLEDLIDSIKARISDPAKQLIAVALATDLAQLQVRQLAGEDVAQELLHLRAQATSLGAIEAATLRDVYVGWVGAIAGALVQGVLSGL